MKGVGVGVTAYNRDGEEEVCEVRGIKYAIKLGL